MENIESEAMITTQKDVGEAEVCWMCRDTKIVEEAICGHCKAGTLNSSCDDTWIKKIPCPVCSEAKA